MNITDALSELGMKIGLPELALDGGGVCRLVFDSKFAVDFEYVEDDELLHLHAPLLPIPAENREALYTTLMHAHLLGAETGGAVFALDDYAGEVVLFRTLHMPGIDFQAFVSAIEDFVQQLENWTSKLNAPLPDSAKRDGDAEANLAHNHFVIRG